MLPKQMLNTSNSKEDFNFQLPEVKLKQQSSLPKQKKNTVYIQNNVFNFMVGQGSNNSPV